MIVVCLGSEGVSWGVTQGSLSQCSIPTWRGLHPQLWVSPQIILLGGPFDDLWPHSSGGQWCPWWVPSIRCWSVCTDLSTPASKLGTGMGRVLKETLNIVFCHFTNNISIVLGDVLWRWLPKESIFFLAKSENLKKNEEENKTTYIPPPTDNHV